MGEGGAATLGGWGSSSAGGRWPTHAGMEMEAGGSDLDWIWAAAAIGRRGLGFREWTRMRGSARVSPQVGLVGEARSDGYRWIREDPMVFCA